MALIAVDAVDEDSLTLIVSAGVGRAERVDTWASRLENLVELTKLGDWVTGTIMCFHGESEIVVVTVSMVTTTHFLESGFARAWATQPATKESEIHDDP